MDPGEPPGKLMHVGPAKELQGAAKRTQEASKRRQEDSRRRQEAPRRHQDPILVDFWNQDEAKLIIKLDASEILCSNCLEPNNYDFFNIVS